MANPKPIVTPFAENGTRNDIPEAGADQPQLATMSGGWGVITQTPINEGGIPPERADFNGLGHLTTSHLAFLNRGQWYGYDANFSGKIGGYPLHARLMLDNGDIVQSTIPNNTNDPNNNLSGWKIDQSIKTISDISELPENPKDGDVVFVKGYYKATNFALAQPFKGGSTRVYVSSRSSENDGILCINGWVLQDEVITSEMCGCYVDGETDDSFFLQRAIDVLSPNKIPLHLSSGTHLVDTVKKDIYNPISPFLVRSYILDIKSNMCIIGDSETTVIKYANGVTHGNDWVGDNGATLFSANPRNDLFNLQFIGIVVDQNGLNNKQTHEVDKVQANQAITLSTGSNCVIKNCVFKDFSGMQVIYSRNYSDIDGSVSDSKPPFQNVRVINNTFINCGWLDGTNWRIDGVHDHSTVYIAGTYQILNNKFIQNTVGMYAGTAMEMHGEGFVAGNYIKSYANCFLSVGQYRNAHNVIIGNKALDCASLAYTDTHSRILNQPLSNTMELISNYFRQATFYIDQTWTFGKDRCMIGITGFGQHNQVKVVIKDNVFETDSLYTGRTDDDLAKYNSFISTQFFNDLTIENNTVLGHKGSLYKIGKVTTSGSCTVKSVKNTFKFCGISGNTLAGNSINYNWNQDALDYGVKLQELSSIDDIFDHCFFKYIVSSPVNADDMVVPNEVTFNSNFYGGFAPVVYSWFGAGDVKPSVSMFFNIKATRPSNNVVINENVGESFNSYNQWGLYTIYKDKQFPMIYKKDGSTTNWILS